MNSISTTYGSMKKIPTPICQKTKQLRNVLNIFGLQHRLSIYKRQRFLLACYLHVGMYTYIIYICGDPTTM